MYLYFLASIAPAEACNAIVGRRGGCTKGRRLGAHGHHSGAIFDMVTSSGAIFGAASTIRGYPRRSTRAHHLAALCLLVYAPG